MLEEQNVATRALHSIGRIHILARENNLRQDTEHAHKKLRRAIDGMLKIPRNARHFRLIEERDNTA